MPVSNIAVAAVCAASGGGARWIGSQGVSAGNGGPWSCTAPADIQQSAEHGFADRRGQRTAGRRAPASRGASRTWPARRWRARSRRRGGSALRRSGRFLVDMQRLADRRQSGAIERDVQHGAADGAHSATGARARAADTCQTGFHHCLGRLRDGADHVSAADDTDQLAVTHDRHALDAVLSPSCSASSVTLALRSRRSPALVIRSPTCGGRAARIPGTPAPGRCRRPARSATRRGA